MTPKILAVAIVASVAFTAPTASAQEVGPLAGKGENIQPIVRVAMAGANEVELAGDWAFVSLDETEAGSGGLGIVNVADPQRPFVESLWRASDAGIADASFGDVDLSADGNLAVLTNAHCGECAEGEVVRVALIDVRDKSRPRLIGKIVDDASMDYVHTATLDGTTLYLNPQVAAFYPQPGNAHISVFDVSDPSRPAKQGVIAPPGADAGLAHDSYVDHRPDGKTLMYAASVHKSDVIDITDPLKSNWLQSATSEYTISHDVQPNHDRSVIIVDDEGAAGGQLDESVSACGKVGDGAASVDSGSLQFFRAAPDGTFADGGVLHLGTFNAPTNVNTGACVAHVFWQAPDENRLTQAYYRTGAFVVDFEDPTAPRMLGWFVADGGAMYWSNKPHRGYLYATNMEGSLDILRYTGEGGTRWPATAGPAEVQRAARQGVPYVPVASTGSEAGASAGGQPSARTSAAGTAAGAGPSSTAGDRSRGVSARRLRAFRLRVRIKRVPGLRDTPVPLALTFTDRRGTVVERLVARRRAGRPAVVAVTGVALTGRYRWRLARGGRVLDRGRVELRRRSGLALAPGATLVAVEHRRPLG